MNVLPSKSKDSQRWRRALRHLPCSVLIVIACCGCRLFAGYGVGSDPADASVDMAADTSMDIPAEASVDMPDDASVDIPAEASVDSTPDGCPGDGFSCVFTRFPSTGYSHPLGTSIFSLVRAAAAGDLDKDGNLDLATAHQDGKVRVSLGKGDGTFDPPVLYSCGKELVDILIVDLDGDTHLDLVTTNRGQSGAPGEVHVLRGVGNGTFMPAQTYLTTCNWPNHLAVGAFKAGSQSADFLVLTTELGPNRAEVYSVSATGGLVYKKGYSPGTAGRSAAIGDLDGDGFNDLALAALYGELLVLVGDGSGGFTPTSSVSTKSPADLVVADVDRDGKLDLVVANHNDGISLLLGDGTAGRAYHPQTNPTATGFTLGGVGLVSREWTWSVVVADLDEDGNLDAVTLSSEADKISVFLGDGLGGLGPEATFGTGNYPYDLVVGDFDNDGHADIVAPTLYSHSADVFLSSW